MISTGAERAGVERIHEGVGRGAQASDAGQHRVHFSSRHGCHNNRHRRRGVVTLLAGSPEQVDYIIVYINFVCKVRLALVPTLEWIPTGF